MNKLLTICTFLLLNFDAITDDNIFTLEEILERVLITSPDLGVIDKDLDISQSKVKKAKAQKYPQFDGAVITGGIFTIVRADLFQPIFTFGKISSDEKKAEKGLEATIANVSEARNDTITRAKTAYFNLQLAHTLNGLANEGRDEAKKVLTSVEELIRVGSPKATQMDKLNLKILLSNFNKDVVTSEKEIDISRAQLMRMLTIEEKDSFDIDSHTIKPVEFKLNELSYYKEKTQVNRPKLKAINAGIESKWHSVKREKSDYYPTIFVGGTLRYNQSTIFEDTIIGGAGIGIRQVLNYTISADLSEAKAEYSKSLREKDVFLKDIDLEVEKAYLNMKENADNLEYGNEGFGEAKKLLQNAISNYDLGIGSLNELINAFGTYLREGTEYYQTVFLYNISAANLEMVTGDL
ncbi:MAG: TolC family protein [Deltaproteobacteria bacterium]|nr:TolC family protein [Deltaproteobacteria bacterium]